MMLELTRKVTIETLVLVAVWKQPFIFQGCFQVTDSISEKKILYYFRAVYEKSDHTNRINNDFSPYDYCFTHLYHEANLIQLDLLTEAKEAAIYALKYALHMTLLEMLKQEHNHFLSIDDTAMHAMIERIKPSLDQNVLINLADDLGFATSVEFEPQEKTAQLAVSTLLSKFAKQNRRKVSIH